MGRKCKRQKTINPNPKHQNEEEEDRLSNLPDGILIEILNLLPIKTAASTTVLSQRWRNLWTQITSVTINDRHFQNSSSNFHSIADAIISQLTSPLIRSFTLQLGDSLDLPPSDVINSWLRKICTRNVELIMVHSERCYDLSLLLKLEPCVFQSKSLVHLHLLHLFDCEFPEFEQFCLPQLKNLGLHCRSSQSWIVNKLTRASPLLEFLYLISFNFEGFDDAVIDVTSYSLRDLIMYCFDDSGTMKFVINAPNLRHLFVTARGGSICSSTTNLSAALHVVRIKVLSENLALSLLKLVPSVQYLIIDLVTLGVLKSLRGENKDMKPLVFRKLEHLTLEFFGGSVDKLSWSPTDSVPTRLLTHVKHITIKLSKISNETPLLNLTKRLLSGARTLKEFKFRISFEDGGRNLDEALRELKFCREVLGCLHSRSSKCQIGFSGKYVEISADGVKIRRSDGCLMTPEEVRPERMNRNS